MDWHAALLISALAALGGGLLYLPFFIWFRLRRSRPKVGRFSSLRVTGAGLCFYGAEVLILMAGLATGTLYPTSWLGAQVNTLFGGLGYATTVVVATAFVEWALVKRGSRFVFRSNDSQSRRRAGQPQH